MEWQGWLTLIVVLLALVAMMREIAGPDLVMMAALFALAGCGIITPEETFAGFANPALAAVGVLFVGSAAMLGCERVRKPSPSDVVLTLTRLAAATGVLQLTP